MAASEYMEALNQGVLYERTRQSTLNQLALLAEFEALIAGDQARTSPATSAKGKTTTIRPPSWKVDGRSGTPIGENR